MNWLRSSALGARLFGSQGAFFAAFNAASVLNYVFLLAMSRMLDEDGFALFAALFGAIYLSSALSNTLMASTAAQVAAQPEAAAVIVRRRVRMLALGLAPMLGMTLLAARPAASYLNSDNEFGVVLVGLAVWLALLTGVGYGGLQGRERFVLLGVGFLLPAAGRLTLGAALVAAGAGENGALVGVVAGMAIAAALVLAPFWKHSSTRGAPQVGLAHEGMFAALVASIAIAIPTSADVVLVRHYLPAGEAAAYAAVSMLGKAIIFGPMAVALMYFPAMVRARRDAAEAGRLLRQTLMVTAAVAGGLALVLIAGAEMRPQLFFGDYRPTTAMLDAYTVAMAAFALAVSLLYFHLALQRNLVLASVPVGLAVQLGVIAAWHPDTTSIAMTLAAGNLALCVLLAACTLRGRPQGRVTIDAAVAVTVLETRHAA
jgi:O-antigen/teichoic acid export membrane protein